MLQYWTHLNGHALAARDGEFGAVKDALFEDQNWLLRYLVVDTGHWLPGRKVLIPVSALGDLTPGEQVFPVDRTREQVKNAPGLEDDQPVSRQFEAALHDHFQWLPYWGYQGVGGAQPVVTPVAVPAAEGPVPTEPSGDPHLRSLKEIAHYHASANGDDIGRVNDFVVDTGRWRLVLILIETGHWLPGRKIAVPVERVEEVRLAGEMLDVGCRREALKQAPELSPDHPLEHATLQLLQSYYKDHCH